MAAIPNNLLNLSSLVSGLAELAPVKKHLLRAGREFLLAINGLLGFADQYVSGDPTASDRQELLGSALKYARKAVRTIAQQLPRGDEEEYRMLHRKVIDSILDVLDGEIRKNSRLPNPKAKLKVEVFQAIRNVLLKETDHDQPE